MELGHVYERRGGRLVKDGDPWRGPGLAPRATLSGRQRTAGGQQPQRAAASIPGRRRRYLGITPRLRPGCAPFAARRQARLTAGAAGGRGLVGEKRRCRGLGVGPAEKRGEPRHRRAPACLDPLAPPRHGKASEDQDRAIRLPCQCVLRVGASGRHSRERTLTRQDLPHELGRLADLIVEPLVQPDNDGVIRLNSLQRDLDLLSHLRG